MKLITKIKGYFFVPKYPNIKVSLKAIKKYKDIVRDANKLEDEYVVYKINKMFAFSKKVYTYKHKDIHRYYDINLLVIDGTIRSVWRSKRQYDVIYVNKFACKLWKNKYKFLDM